MRGQVSQPVDDISKVNIILKGSVDLFPCWAKEHLKISVEIDDIEEADAELREGVLKDGSISLELVSHNPGVNGGGIYADKRYTLQVRGWSRPSRGNAIGRGRGRLYTWARIGLADEVARMPSRTRRAARAVAEPPNRKWAVHRYPIYLIIGCGRLDDNKN